MPSTRPRGVQAPAAPRYWGRLRCSSSCQQEVRVKEKEQSLSCLWQVWWGVTLILPLLLYQSTAMQYHLCLPLPRCPLAALAHKLVTVHGWWAFGCKGHSVYWKVTSGQDLRNFSAVRSACMLPDQGLPPPRMPSCFLKSRTILWTKGAGTICTRREAGDWPVQDVQAKLSEKQRCNSEEKTKMGSDNHYIQWNNRTNRVKKNTEGAQSYTLMKNYCILKNKTFIQNKQMILNHHRYKLLPTFVQPFYPSSIWSSLRSLLRLRRQLSIFWIPTENPVKWE